jgi:hypothetical protein
VRRWSLCRLLQGRLSQLLRRLLLLRIRMPSEEHVGSVLKAPIHLAWRLCEMPMRLAYRSILDGTSTPFLDGNVRLHRGKLQSGDMKQILHYALGAMMSKLATRMAVVSECHGASRVGRLCWHSEPVGSVLGSIRSKIETKICSSPETMSQTPSSCDTSY